MYKRYTVIIFFIYNKVNYKFWGDFARRIEAYIIDEDTTRSFVIVVQYGQWKLWNCKNDLNRVF